MSIAVELARREWEQGHRRLVAEADDPQRQARLLEQVEVLTDELRRRIGQTFTLDELARAYAVADAWAREAIADRAGLPGWPRTVALALDEAFYLYARGAVDYAP